VEVAVLPSLPIVSPGPPSRPPVALEAVSLKLVVN
jgi:hypothetical protein